MKKICYLLFLSAFAFNLTANGQAKIKGKIQLAQQVEKIYLQYNTKAMGGWVIDSTKVVDGEFGFNTNIFSEVSEARLFMYHNNEKAKFESATVFLVPGPITLSIKDSLKFMKVEGSRAHTEYVALSERMKPYEAKQTELRNLFRELRNTQDEERMKKADARWKDLRDEIGEKVYAAYLRENPQSAIAEHILSGYTGSWIGIETKKLDNAMALLNSLPEATRKRQSVMEFERRLRAASNTAIGRQAIDFTLNDSLGNAVTLSSLKGKYVFIDFWASWCVPCRADNPNIVKAYNLFRDKNIVIMGVAFDKTNYDKWKNAIQTDKLPYLNVIDTAYPDTSSVGMKYNIGSIPQNVLIDPTGKIIAKNIEGKDLSKKLEELFGKP